MQQVRAKKYLGQHFLNNEEIAKKITDSLNETSQVLEIGPGMGVLTKYLIEKCTTLKLVEIDKESVEYLTKKYKLPAENLICGDFLKLSLDTLFENQPYSLIGNFPYNISNLILFKVFENKNSISEVVGMFQEEVAQRVCASSGNKTYGILSVLLKVFYDIEYLFSVDRQFFNPPPKVQSAVIRLKRNNVSDLDVNEADFVRVVKTAFNQRRKMLRQSLKPLQKNLDKIDEKYLTLRAEQLKKEDFITITKQIYL